MTWTISSGQGKFLDLGANRIKYIGPEWGPDVPNKTVIHLYAGEEIVGECTVNLAVIAPKVEPETAALLPKEPEPEPPPEEEEILEPVDCGVDPENPLEPLKIRPTEVMAGPLQEVKIGIVKIWQVCEEGCYTWRISSGGGQLLCNCGREAIYLTPRVNAECEANAVIDLIYDERVIASCYVTINTWGPSSLAYVVFKKPAIEGMDLYPGWRASEKPGIPAGVEAPSWVIVGRAQRYDCNDRPLQPLMYLHIWCSCGYSIFAKKWQIYIGEYRGVGGVYDTLEEVPMHILYKNHPDQTVDSRTLWMKRGGCCPYGLIGITYGFEW